MKALLQGVLDWLHERFDPLSINKLEAYVMSKNPKTVSDLEFWIREYDRKAK